jgi:hypothetical protein
MNAEPYPDPNWQLLTLTHEQRDMNQYRRERERKTPRASALFLSRACAQESSVNFSVY